MQPNQGRTDKSNQLSHHGTRLRFPQPTNNPVVSISDLVHGDTANNVYQTKAPHCWQILWKHSSKEFRITTSVRMKEKRKKWQRKKEKDRERYREKRERETENEKRIVKRNNKNIIGKFDNIYIFFLSKFNRCFFFF